MKAEAIIDERYVFDDRSFADLVIWLLPHALPGSEHSFKYRFAFVVEGVCILRYDNESGKGDHRHIEGRQESYQFIDIDVLLDDFFRDVEEWRKTHEDRDV
jgi:Family of unknown function (DUF6516)